MKHLEKIKALTAAHTNETERSRRTERTPAVPDCTKCPSRGLRVLHFGRAGVIIVTRVMTVTDSTARPHARLILQDSCKLA
jgi:hypothetical protein